MTVGNNRGYLKTDGSSKRLRFVQSGYDATDSGVPPNKVIFDSGSIATLAILEVGTYTWLNLSDSGGLTKVRTWDYGFVPLCMFQWSVNDSNSYAGRTNAQSGSQSGLTPGDMIKVALDGIYVSWFNNASIVLPRVDVVWTAFAIDARDGS